MSVDIYEQESINEQERLDLAKNKRKQLRAKITRTIKRIREAIQKGEQNKRLINREAKEVKTDYAAACEMNYILCENADTSLSQKFDDWERDLTYDVYAIEDEVSDYFAALKFQEESGSEATSPRASPKTPPTVRRPPRNSVDPTEQATVQPPSQPNSPDQPQLPLEVDVIQSTPKTDDIEQAPVLNDAIQEPVVPPVVQPVIQNNVQHQTVNNRLRPPTVSHHRREETVNLEPTQTHQRQDATPFLVETRPQVSCDVQQPKAVDSWIDDLIEFSETKINSVKNDLSMIDALYRLEASRDIPNVELLKYDGNPLGYTEFVERFKLYIHDKPHLSDDLRMVQLKMHLTGNASRIMSGLGVQGIMYATALKTLKAEFGQPSVIARAHIDKLTKGGKLSNNDRHGLRELSLDMVNCIAALKQINHYADVNANDSLRKIVKRLPDPLIEKWKTTATDLREKGKTPDIYHIYDFIKRHVKAAYDPDFGDIEKSNKNPAGHVKFQRKGVHSAQTKPTVRKCYVCEENHRVSECPTFSDSTTAERIEITKRLRLCYSCLIKGHMSKDCRSKRQCGKEGCTKVHHILLHTNPPGTGSASPLDKASIMPVVRVLFRSANGRTREGNVLIDSGAGTTVIRKDFAKALGLQGQKEKLDLVVVGGDRLQQPYSRRLKFWISSLSGSEEFSIEAHEIEKTILSVPPLDRAWLSKFSHLQDIHFDHKAGPIDLILGVQYSHLHAEEEVRQGLPFEPLGKRTKLGWFAIGCDNAKMLASICHVDVAKKIDLSKLYDLETLGVQAPDCSCQKSAMSQDDKKVVELFERSCTKDGDRYVIGLPWKRDPLELPDNFPLAEKRLISLERSLSRNHERGEMYKSAMNEYISKGWAVPLTEEELTSDTRPIYYLPHHGVYRPDKVSTPLRIVFDPASTFKGASLNSFLFKGPCLIGNLLGVLLRFREEEVAFTGDISKMYLQICLPEADTHVHRFLWRNLETQFKPKIYRLLRVTFGDKPSPDMASYVLLHIGEKHKSEYPNASVVIERDRYMDDLIHSCRTSEEAIKCIDQLDHVLQTGSFKIKEWYCSSETVRQQLHSSGTDTHSCPEMTDVTLDGENDIKTLGIVWNPGTDVLRFVVKDINIETFTKRNVLSKLSMLYDPLGLASVVTIKARIAMQNLWRLKELNWDDPLPENVCDLWQNIFEDIVKLKTVEFPRCIKPADSLGQAELHVFCDASVLAYGAAAYLLWHAVDGPHVQLISAKARVAPLKQTTVPRLELMAALIASRLAKTICEEFKEKPAEITLWSDSKIVLHWLKSDSLTLKPFVGVRVAEIQSTWESGNWRFVPTDKNVADDLSRGLPTEEIQGRWMHGPAFLKQPRSEWPTETIHAPSDDPEKRKTKVICATAVSEPLIEAERYGTWTKLLRVTAYMLRFVNNIKQRIKKASTCLDGQLKLEEIERAEIYWIRAAQSTVPSWELRYRDLTPFQQDGIVRVGGRLGRSSLTYDEIHPILLPADHIVTSLVAKDIHDRIGHPGSERTLCAIRRKFWIVQGRRIVKGMVKKCVVCRKFRQPAHTTLMADLPPERLRPFSPPFSVTGVDLFGPFMLKYGRNKSIKAWGALFTCATVRAIHLDIVENLSTPAFLQTLRRFVAHHGWPKVFISDNGKNFVGAQAELKKLVQEGQKQIEEFAVLHKVVWKFNTPLSPHQGGLFESMIKQSKNALRIAIGQQTLSWNEMATVFAEIECLINSRPIGYSSNDPNDLQPLTPNHFILGRASASVPQGPYEETKNLHKRFKFVQMLVKQFWKRFVHEYIPTLMRRSKWYLKGRQLQVGDVVLLTESNTSRGKWDLARITEVYPGHDGIVRNVQVKTKNGEYKRSVQKCCLIMESEN